MRNNWFIFHQLAIFKINTNNYVNGFPGGSVVKNLPASAGDTRDVGSIPGSGISPGGGNGNLFQYSCLENSMGKGTWWATVHGGAKSQTQLSRQTDTGK